MEDEIETATPETQAEHPEKTVETAHPHDDSKDLIHALSERVTLLEGTVQSLIPQNQDEKPVKQPWTHRKFG